MISHKSTGNCLRRRETLENHKGGEIKGNMQLILTLCCRILQHRDSCLTSICEKKQNNWNELD